MPALTIPDIPDEVRAELEVRAQQAGATLEEYVRHELMALVSRRLTTEMVAETRAFAREHGADLDVDTILAARDADRR